MTYAIAQAVLIASPHARVFDAITSTAGLRAWWTPGATAFPEVGSIARFPFGPDYSKAMEITEFDAPQRLAWRCIDGAEEWISTTLTFDLEPNALASHPEISGQAEQLSDTSAATLLTFQHQGWRAQSPMFAECSYTWGRFLWSLKLYCETGAGLPWPTQHRVLRQAHR